MLSTSEAIEQDQNKRGTYGRKIKNDEPKPTDVPVEVYSSLDANYLTHPSIWTANALKRGASFIDVNLLFPERINSPHSVGQARPGSSPLAQRVQDLARITQPSVIPSGMTVT